VTVLKNVTKVHTAPVLIARGLRKQVIIFKHTKFGPCMHARYAIPMNDYLYQYLDPKILTERRWCIQLLTFKRHAWSNRVL